MSDKIYWLKCKVEDGMFSQEKIVESETAEGRQFSLFANNSLLKNPDNSGDNFLSVRVYERHENTYDVLLPVEPFGVSRLISVNLNHVQEV